MSKNTKLSFRVYSAWNYQKEIEDLEKARFYLDRKIERLKNGSGMRRMR